MGLGKRALWAESGFSSVRAGRAALQPREVDGRSFQVLRVRDGDGS